MQRAGSQSLSKIASAWRWADWHPEWRKMSNLENTALWCTEKGIWSHLLPTLICKHGCLSHTDYWVITRNRPRHDRMRSHGLWIKDGRVHRPTGRGEACGVDGEKERGGERLPTPSLKPTQRALALAPAPASLEWRTINLHIAAVLINAAESS